MIANSFLIKINIRREKACKKEIQNMQHINILIKIFLVQSIEDYERKAFERLHRRRLKSFPNGER